MRKTHQVWLPILLVCFATVAASAQSFRVQCPTSTITHPSANNNDSEPAYTAATQYKCTVTNGCGGSAGNVGYLVPIAANGAIKCQQISGGDGYATMADGTQTYMFSFGPLSGLAQDCRRTAGHRQPRANSIRSTPRPRILIRSRAIPQPRMEPSDSPYSVGNLLALSSIQRRGWTV